MVEKLPSQYRLLRLERKPKEPNPVPQKGNEMILWAFIESELGQKSPSPETELLNISGTKAGQR